MDSEAAILKVALAVVVQAEVQAVDHFLLPHQEEAAVSIISLSSRSKQSLSFYGL